MTSDMLWEKYDHFYDTIRKKEEISSAFINQFGQ